MSHTPELAVIIPAHRGGTMLRACLAGVAEQTQPPAECVVVADGPAAGADSELRQAVEEAGVRLIVQSFQGGPSAARNTGVANTASPVVFFVDSDVILAPDACERAWTDVGEGAADAVFGSYDENPGDPGFTSQYKNLVHHLVHQRAEVEVHSFWGACGVVSRRAFADVGGFDEAYTRPCIEDVELGQRLSQAGWRIRLDPQLTVSHLKRWTPAGLVRTDLFDRAVPWTELILRTNTVSDDLGTEATARAQLVLTGLGVLGLAGSPLLGKPSALTAAVFLGAAVALDAPLLRGLARLRGPFFAVRSVPWRLAHYAICVLGLSIGVAHVAAERAGRRDLVPARLRSTSELIRVEQNS